LAIGRLQVARWRDRLLEVGIAALRQDRPRGSGRKVRVDADEVVRWTTQSCPSDATHWSTRLMAAMAGTSAATVNRIWRVHGLKPLRSTKFMISRDPKFVHRRLVHESSGECAGLHPAAPSLAEGAGTNHDARLQASWHNYLVCRTQCAGRNCHWAVSAKAPPHPVVEVLR
jgi:Homeodomain-like domain